MKKKALAIICVCTLIALMVTNSKLFVQATGYNIVVRVSSPVQNKTYITGDIPLSFICDANITDPTLVANCTVVYAYNLDGKTVPWGESSRMGQFYQPFPFFHSSSIHVPSGNHSLFVLVTFWITPVDEYADTFKMNNVSQVVNFTVNADLPTIPNSPTPLPSEQPQLAEQDVILGVAVTVTAVCIVLGLLVYFIKRK